MPSQPELRRPYWGGLSGRLAVISKSTAESAGRARSQANSPPLIAVFGEHLGEGDLHELVSAGHGRSSGGLVAGGTARPGRRSMKTGRPYLASSQSTRARAIRPLPSAHWPITDEGVAFDSDTATGMMPAAHRVAGVLAFQ